MNLIGLCQGANLRIFAHLLERIRGELAIERIGIFVADARYARRAPEAVVLRRDATVDWLEEWESLVAGLARAPDLALIRRYEDELGSPSLWAGLLADRRLFFGRYCKFRQDYRPRYSERQMLGALTEALIRVERLFENARPNLILGFAPVTLHEYIALRLAEARGIPFLLLRSTKIDNYVSLNDRLFGLSRHVEARLDTALDDSTAANVAEAYVARTREHGSIYEGMHRPAHARRAIQPARTVRALAAAVKHEVLRLADPVVRRDPHNPGYLVPALLERLVQPWRAYRLRRFIRASAHTYDAFGDQEFCLFPLHFEPEIALQIYGRPLQNQIEVARTLALALPVGMKLVVKEHPRAAGFRPLGYYRRLLDIPNVLIAAPELSSQRLVRDAALVVVITGNIGLEAASAGKPVIVLGETDYSVLPPHMLRTCRNLYDLSADIRALLSTFRLDENALKRFLAAVVAGAVPVDLYSVLLRKPERFRSKEADFETDMRRLARYVVVRVHVVLNSGEVCNASA